MAANSSFSALDHETSTLPSGTVVHIWRVPNPFAIVILQHGFGEYAERYVDQHHSLIRNLNKHKYEVRALDLWGHGRSTGARGATHIRRAVRDHVEVRKTASKEGLPIFLFGHSLGGLVTVGSVTMDTITYYWVILTGPAFPSPLPRLVQCVVEAAATIIPHIPIPHKPAPLSGLGCMEKTAVLAEAGVMMLKKQVPFLLAATQLQTMQAVRGNCARWIVPTLVMHGTANSYKDPAGSKEFFETIGSDDKTLSLYEGEYHELLHDLEREVALREILGWLEGQLRK